VNHARGIMKALVSLAAVLLISGLMSGTAMASDLSDAPSAYLTKLNITLVTVDALAKSADELFTMQNAARPGFQEHDPLARPFVTHGRAIAGTSEGLLFAGEVFTSYELHKHGHRRLAKAVLLLGIGSNTAGIATTTR
jgi:hypothetical protein